MSLLDKKLNDKDYTCENVDGLPTYKIVFVEDTNAGVESVVFTDNPINGKYFVYFMDNKKTEENATL